MDIVDNVDNDLQVASLHKMWTMWTITFLLSTLSTLSLFLFAWEFPARGFVDNVDMWTIVFKSLDPPLPIF
jgi:hypothetical protein